MIPWGNGGEFPRLVVNLETKVSPFNFPQPEVIYCAAARTGILKVFASVFPDPRGHLINGSGSRGGGMGE